MSGSGQETLAEVVVGLAVPSAGEVERASDTTAYIPEDRDQSLARRLSLADNVIVHRHAERELRRFGRLDRTRVQRFVAEVLQRSRIVEPRPNAFGETPRAATSSGWSRARGSSATPTSSSPTTRIAA
ncbi:MAG: hypothetical protein R2736_07350 [Solirubrobacterales bacterium]